MNKAYELSWVEDYNHNIAGDCLLGLQDLIDAGIFPDLEASVYEDTLTIKGPEDQVNKAIDKIQDTYVEYGQIVVKEIRTESMVAEATKIESFDPNVQDIFEHFDIKNQVAKLAKANLLYLLIKKFSETNVDLSPKNISNHEMGTLFEELIRKFSETSNEEAGEHFTPRDVVKLMTELMFVGEKGLEEDNVIKTIYDPACGTGGMLTSCKEYITSKNPTMDVVLFGQEINPEIYAICKADMLMKGEIAKNIKGPSSTLSNDGLSDKRFDYMISNPPYGTDWEKDKDVVDAEAELGFGGRFGAGTPRKSDGQLLFIQHMISKMKMHGEKSRIAVITNGSPLFTGDAGSGESNIRKWIFENDYLETLVALPNQLFFNTDIGTYVWILTNKKDSERKGKVQLKDSFISFVGNEAFIKGMHISKCETAGAYFQHDEDRDRKLLLHKHEIIKLASKVKIQGFTVIPLKIYLKDGLAKLEIALAKGKTLYDKRSDDKIKTMEREARKALKR